MKWLMLPRKTLTLIHPLWLLQRIRHIVPEDSNMLDELGGTRWLIGRFVAFRSKGFRFESRQVETLGKSFTRSCLWRFGVKLRHSIRAVSGAPMSSSGLVEAL